MTAPELRPWLVWGTGLLACVVVMLDSTVFGVSGLDAAGRFGASPGVLSSFMVLPVIAFGGGQIPAGVLLDRFGPRATVATGVAVISFGQLTLGLTHSLPMAVGGYAMVGLGGAPVFISVIRLLPAWFAPARVPLLTQLTAIGATLGQVLSAVPFLAILQRNGWTAAYLCTVAVGAASIVLTLTLMRDAPKEARDISPTRTLRATLGDVKAVWSHPGTRLGFFTLMGTYFSINVFALVWGVPYLTTAQGMSHSAAGALLTIPVAVFAVAGVPVGIISGRYPRRRPALVLAMIGISGLAWTAVLVLPMRAPTWLLVLLIVVISIGQPFAYIAFDFARAFNSPATLGTAQGMVNTAGSVALLFVMQVMGITIDLAGGYSFGAFRLAWTVQYVIWVVAAAGVVVTARKAQVSVLSH
jgi:MFS family permease